MNAFYLNLSPPDENRSTVYKLYIFMALAFLAVGGLGVYKRYTQEEQELLEYLFPLFQMALAITYLVLAWRRSRPLGKRYVQVTDQQLELKLDPATTALTLPWDSISLLRIQPDKLIYRLNSGSSAEVSLENVPEQHLEAVREAIRSAGRGKGVSL